MPSGRLALTEEHAQMNRLLWIVVAYLLLAIIVVYASQAGLPS